MVVCVCSVLCLSQPQVLCVVSCLLCLSQTQVLCVVRCVLCLSQPQVLCVVSCVLCVQATEHTERLDSELQALQQLEGQADSR